MKYLGFSSLSNNLTIDPVRILARPKVSEGIQQQRLGQRFKQEGIIYILWSNNANLHETVSVDHLRGEFGPGATVPHAAVSNPT